MGRIGCCKRSARWKANATNHDEQQITGSHFAFHESKLDGCIKVTKTGYYELACRSIQLKQLLMYHMSDQSPN
eukprot:scaffold4703_cov108-Cylindrotheca_fusiformis.AAC.11